MIRCFAALLILAGLGVADAAPNIPSSELPGRERERFQKSPLDRFMQPGTTQQKKKPVWRRHCRNSQAKRTKHRRGPSARC
jgi:hypothetical protein